MSLNKRVAQATLIALAIIAYTKSAAAIDVLVPAYFYPYQTGSDWSRLDDALEQVGITAIMNPASGPGASVDSNYTAVTTSFKNAGGTLIGYITSSYFRQPTAPYAPRAPSRMLGRFDGLSCSLLSKIAWIEICAHPRHRRQATWHPWRFKEKAVSA